MNTKKSMTYKSNSYILNKSCTCRENVSVTSGTLIVNVGQTWFIKNCYNREGLLSKRRAVKHRLLRSEVSQKYNMDGDNVEPYVGSAVEGMKSFSESVEDHTNASECHGADDVSVWVRI